MIQTRSSGSLAAKLLRVVLGIYLSVALLVTIGQLILEYRNEKSRLSTEIHSAAQTFGPILSQSLWNVDTEQTKAALLGVLGINYDVLNVKLLNISGETAHEYESPGSQASVRFLPFLTKNTASPWYETYTYAFDLEFNSDYTGDYKVGTLVLSSDSHVVLNRAAHTFMITIISALFKTAFLCLIFYFIMHRMVGRPLRQVTRAMAQLDPASQEEDSSTIRVYPELLNRDDELGTMTKAFQQMQAALHERNRALHVHQSQLEEKIHERTAQLENAAHSKTEFLAAMSHEIRTPMNGVIGMTQLLSGTSLNEKQLKYVKVIQNSSESLIDIINGILDHLKIDAGKMQIESTGFNFETLFDDCVAMFTYRSKESNIALTPAFMPDCPTWVSGDPTRLRQIIINLLGNAFKFTREGEIVLQAQNLGESEPGVTCIRISVKDSGIGIAPEKLDTLFTPFNQADTSTTRRYGGTGLGLSICKRLTEIMGGTIGVHSELGQGSCFWVEIPLRLSSKAAAESAPQDAGADALRGKRLLIVDDHPTFCDVTSDIVENWQMSAICRSSGKDVVATLRQAQHDAKPVDVVIIDISLPDISGIALSREVVRELSPNPPSIILVSAYQDLPAPILSEIGVSLFLEKPISNRELRRALIQVLFRPDHIPSDKPDQLPDLPFHRLKVLVAEDNTVNQLVITGFLNKFGISPIVVENGLKAIEHCKSGTHFDLILMDGEMPEVDGWEAARQIRALQRSMPGGRRTTIVALSAHAMARHVAKAAACGMDGYLRKPFTIDQLQDLLQEVLNGGPQEPLAQLN